MCLLRLAAERRLTTLESFVQECLQVVTTMNANVAQQLLNHLQQDNVMEGDHCQQPIKPPHPQSHSLKAHDDSVSKKLHVCTYRIITLLSY